MEFKGTGLEIVADAVSGLPAPVRTSFFKAISDLLGGLTAVPAAKLRQYAQGVEDTTAARSTVAAMIAKAVGEAGIADPLLMQAAADIYLPVTLRKAKNRLRVAQKAAEHINEAATNESQPAPPEDDWMNTFMRFAEDASSEQLQDLYGRILAGQIVRPSSFALATLRAISELDHSTAQDFSLIWSKSVGEAVDFGPDFQRGDDFTRWKRLAEAGLMAPSDTAQYLPPYVPMVNGNGLWTPMVTSDTFLLIQFPEHCEARWAHIDFTRVGRQIGSILARPDYETNMRDAGQKLAQQGVAKIELHSTGKPVAVIYQAP